jgi:hypothetical protein
LEHKFEKIKGIDLSGGGNAAGQKLLGRYFWTRSSFDRPGVDPIAVEEIQRSVARD